MVLKFCTLVVSVFRSKTCGMVLYGDIFGYYVRFALGPNDSQYCLLGHIVRLHPSNHPLYIHAQSFSHLIALSNNKF